MTITVLGTSGATPAYGRHLSGTVVQVGARTFLVDCGEGTQLRLADAGVSAHRLDAVFVTHLHGDHFYGLPGLMGTLALLDRATPLVLVGPPGVGAWLAGTPGADPARLPFPLDIREWRAFGDTAPGPEAPGDAASDDVCTVWQDDACTVTSRPLEHGVVCRGYRFDAAPRQGNLDVDAARALGLTDPAAYRALKAGHAVTAPDGRTVHAREVVRPALAPVSFAYCLDTRPCVGATALAARATLVLHDSTFGDDQAARAPGTGHSTAREAATTARDAGAARLLLTHISARYPTPDALVAEARTVFAATDAAVELAPVEVV